MAASKASSAGARPAAGAGPAAIAGPRKRRRRRTGLLAGLTAIVALLLLSFGAPSASAQPWSCNAFGYLFQTYPKATTSEIVQVDLATGEQKAVGSTPNVVNAVGYDMVDNYFYGMQQKETVAGGKSWELVRIHADGSVDELGVPTGPGGTVDPTSSYPVGEVDPSGHYWVSDDKVWYEVDLTTATPTVLRSGTVELPAGLTGWGNDWSWINGALYTFGRNAAGESFLLRFDPTTTKFTNLGSIPETGFGASFADAAGYLYGSQNSTNDVYRINVTTLETLPAAEGVGSSPGNDGARCAAAPVPTVTVTKTVEGRVRSTDQFTIGLFRPDGSQAESKTTSGAATSTSTTNFPASQGKTYTITDAMAAGSPSKIGEYVQSIKCTDATGAAAPTGGTPGKWTLDIAAATAYTCAVTNKAEADLSLTKTSSPTPVVPGEEETFTLTVENKGPSASLGATITDPLPSKFTLASAGNGCTEAGGTVSCPVGELAPGASESFELKGKVAGSLEHCLENTATVSGGPFDPEPNNNKASVCAPLKGKADLSIEKKASAAAVPAGGQISYTLVVKNKGPSDATGVKVDDAMPDGLTLVAADPSQGTCSTAGGEVQCGLGRLVAGGSAQVLVTANADKSGTVTNKAKVHGDQEDPDPGNNEGETTITVTGGPSPGPGGPQPSADLKVKKTANVKRPAVGQVVAYRVVVANDGPDAAPNAKATDTYNAPARLLSVDPSAGTCTKHIAISCELGTIQPGAKVTIKVKLRLTHLGGKQRNAASATSEAKDPDPSNNLDVVQRRVTKVKLKLTKVASKANVHPGQRFGYLIKVKNLTKGVAKKVRVCDRMPAGLAYLGSRPKGRLDKGKLCWTIKRLGPKQAKRYTVTVRALSRGGTKVNQVTATGAGVAAAKAKSVVHVAPAPAKPTPVTG